MHGTPPGMARYRSIWWTRVCGHSSFCFCFCFSFWGLLKSLGFGDPLLISWASHCPTRGPRMFFLSLLQCRGVCQPFPWQLSPCSCSLGNFLLAEVAGVWGYTFAAGCLLVLSGVWTQG